MFYKHNDSRWSELRPLTVLKLVTKSVMCEHRFNILNQSMYTFLLLSLQNRPICYVLDDNCYCYQL